MDNNNYPSLYQAADVASQQAQRKYIILMRLDLLFMLLAALLTIFNLQDETGKVYLYIISGLLLLGGMVITFIIKTQKYEDIWYQGRAIAESVKTLTWRFISCSQDFEVTISLDKVNEKFITRLEELLEGFKDFSKHLNSKILTKPIISSLMKELRSKPLEDRKNYYIKYRIKDQKNWYSDKAEYNRTKENFWFVVIIISQILALCSAVFLIVIPNSNWNLVGVFTTLSSAAIAWLQLKQHQELKQAYNTAVLELNFIEEKSSNITSEIELSKFVLDSENAISREHTLWLAQRKK